MKRSLSLLVILTVAILLSGCSSSEKRARLDYDRYAPIDRSERDGKRFVPDGERKVVETEKKVRKKVKAKNKAAKKSKAKKEKARVAKRDNKDSRIVYNVEKKKGSGMASWYGKPFHGRKTASGEIYDMYAMTAAHKTLPMGTIVEVTNVANDKTVEVTINDRGPYAKGRVLDLSYAAAKELGYIGDGVAKVSFVVIARDMKYKRYLGKTTGGGSTELAALK